MPEFPDPEAGRCREKLTQKRTNFPAILERGSIVYLLIFYSDLPGAHAHDRWLITRPAHIRRQAVA